ncbi:Gag-pol fusion protein [Phytophthora megakarya]|uniref:Gag-pol fusion protein n=1 Tax=Phytophthora megakarya TaxID=4795 RepID=A0A225VP24_9STRA|nr:Gag-pol fusion protein [Phytophthora megakarya]
MTGTTGQMNVIPGVSGTGLPTALTGDWGDMAAAEAEREHVALFTNPPGVYNAYSGTWDTPPGHQWNGKYWYELKKMVRGSASVASSAIKADPKKPAQKQKAKRGEAVSSDSEQEEKPRKKLKAAVKQAVAEDMPLEQPMAVTTATEIRSEKNEMDAGLAVALEAATGEASTSTGGVQGGSVRVARSSTRDERNEVTRRMKAATTSRDAEKAACYVATLRPTMAAARFVRAEREQELAEYAARDQARDRRQAGEGEVKTDVSTAAIACTEMVTTTMTRAMITDAGEMNAKASGEDDLMSARPAKRRTQKADKRRRVKALAVRRRREERAEEAEHRRVADERQARRRQDADAATATLVAKRQQGIEQEVRSGGAARVSLVQHERRVNGEIPGVGRSGAHAVMDFNTNEVRYNEEGRAVVIPFRTYDKKGGATVAAVRMARRTQLDKCTVTPVQVAVTAEDGERGIFVPTKQLGAVMLATTVAEARNGTAWVPAINSSPDEVRLPSKRELGTWIPLDEDMKVLEMNGALQQEKLTAWLNGLDEDDTPLVNEHEMNIGSEERADRALIKRLLQVYREVVADSGDCPPATTLDVEHHIDTGDTAPIMMKRRRMAQTENVVAEDNVRKMLAAGVIEEANGAWGFPVVLVRKKDGEVRFCVDYRALNAVTKKDVYPLPRIDETLEALGGALLFTTLDLRSGYWQIRVADVDKDKTAFTTRSGLYRFVRMPFGLSNAPSTFQRMMNSVLRGLTWSTCLVYLDDIIVFTRGGIERHVLELAVVLERLSAAGLTLKLKKCVFATKSLEYLGHELGCDGVRPLERLATAVRDFPRPTNTKEVKRFVHLAGYYRRFIQNFGSLMAPMTKLLRKSTEWEWAADQEAAFTKVKEILTTRPLLVYPNFTKRFRLETDASKAGLGACLMQDCGDGWKPVAYASKVISPTEANYGITELECAAVVWAIKLFRPYLYGRLFTIVTDHAALRWLMTSPNLTGKLHRWALALQEFEFDVKYRPGSSNSVADALSRAPVAASVRAAVGRRRRSRERTATRLAATDPVNESYTVTGTTAASTNKGNAETGRASTTAAISTTGATSMTGATCTMQSDVGRILKENETTVRAVLSDMVKAVEEGTVPNDEQLQKPTVRDTRRPRTQRRTAGTAIPAGERPMTRAAKRRDEEQRRREAEVAAVATDATTQPQSGASDMEMTDQEGGSQRAAARYGEEPHATTNTVTTQVMVSSAEVPAETNPVPAVPTTTNSKAMRKKSKRVTWASEVTNTERKTASRMPTNRGVATGPSRRPASKPRRVVHRDDVGANQPMDGDDEQRDERRRVQEELEVGELRRQREQEPTLQLTDAEITSAQQRSRLVQRLLTAGAHKGMTVEKAYGLVVIKTSRGRRVVLPPELWATVFKENHDSIWAGHLRATHTHARIAHVFWWPGLQREVRRWVAGCQECGSRKARPREVVPPLRSLRGGAVGDRWALDVAGPLPASDGGQRYVLAAVEYVTRYAVAAAVTQHTAESVARFLMKHVVLRFGPFRELLTDGAPELTGYAIEKLVTLLQAEQTTPVPYRPQMIGLVERFHRTWKDLVAMYMHNDTQNDWDSWVDWAVYAYNSGRHSTVELSPNELMMGRRLRMPNELLRGTELTEVSGLSAYHKELLATMKSTHECAERARRKEQERQAKYYNRRNVRNKKSFKKGDRVWMYRPPRGAKATKFVHAWIGPMKIVDEVGYENYLIEREDGENHEQIIAHVSFLITYHYPATLLQRTADDIAAQLEHEAQSDEQAGVAPARTIAGAASTPGATTPARRSTKRRRAAVASEDAKRQQDTGMVKLRRRRRRNAAGHYVLEYELRPVCDGRSADGDGERRWVSVREYDAVFEAGKVVEDLEYGEGV